MDKVVARRLRSWERSMLHAMKRQLCNTVNSRHARIILLSSGRTGNREIAQRVGVAPAWIREIIHRFNGGALYHQLGRLPEPEVTHRFC